MRKRATEKRKHFRAAALKKREAANPAVQKGLCFLPEMSVLWVDTHRFPSEQELRSGSGGGPEVFETAVSGGHRGCSKAGRHCAATPPQKKRSQRHTAASGKEKAA